MLLFGAYPGVALEKNASEKKLDIKDIYQSYVEKDLTDFLRVDNVDAFNRVVGLLANQIGALLNIESLARTARLPRTVVENYLTILDHTFVIKLIFPFFRNYAKEITKTPKVYFLDLGLRNFVISRFAELDFRNDTGKLLENFYLLELLNQDPHGLQKINFWRTTNQTEIDFIVSREGKQEAIEVKWESAAKPKSFATIKKYYPDMETRLVNRSGFR
jgi:hypothetical protein